ncbi:ubiquitin-activating enzyme E1 2-like [Wolffia australiana]
MAEVENGRIPSEIDENLHSRQLAVYGRETMRRLFASSVLISGINGLGAEIAKNLVLAGVKSVTLHDEEIVELWDLSSNFFLGEEDVGKNRALACVQKLQELNSAVAISTITSSLSKEHLSGFQAVVFTEISLQKAIEFDDYCHNHQPPISFIKSEVRGLFGSIFVDFGPEFTVNDVDGEEPHTGIIASISNDHPALVSCVDDERLEFQDGDLVVFSEVEGMPELNDGQPRRIKNTRAYSFFLEEDTTKYGPYLKGGIVTQVKLPKILKFKTLREALVDPGEFLLSDFSKPERPQLLHVAFQALDQFKIKNQRFPKAGYEEDAQELVQLAIAVNAAMGSNKQENLDEEILRVFSSGSRAVLNPMAAMFGGFVGQEVVKACSGKFHPIFQFFYFDSVESLPKERVDPGELWPLSSRYDAQISVFGSSLQKKLEQASVFLVGAGALGCEFLKNFALMGVSCDGKLVVTDDDVIEKSNLSRQFLFRDWNIGQPKSTVAAAAAAAINPSLQVEALQNRVSPETENVFDAAFWGSLDVVVNALDNVKARMYVDQKCVYFQRPLLESGTLGPKCNTQMVIPHLTENYGAARDPPEKQAPMCTLHSFPHNIDHCLTWARSEFEGLLEKTPSEVNKFLSSPVEYCAAICAAGDAQAKDLAESVLECLDSERCTTFQDCIAWARLRFEDYFCNRVKQLTFTFPEDAVTGSGLAFWSAPKRFPSPLWFSADDLGHLCFVAAAAALRAHTFGIPVPDWINSPVLMAEAVNRVHVPDFRPKEGVKIETDDKSTQQVYTTSSMDEDIVINELVGRLKTCIKNLPEGFRMNPVQFEKDDDTNYHMDLIAAMANMRARNYSIKEVDKLKAKFIAGRIIPAIATTTAMATGLVCLELYKVLAGGHTAEDYRNTFANLALPLVAISEPAPPATVSHGGNTWTVWDRWVLPFSPTVRELLEWLRVKGLEGYSITCGSTLVYNSMFPKHKVRLDMKLVDAAKVEVPAHSSHLDLVVACEDEDGEDVDIPLITIPIR